MKVVFNRAEFSGAFATAASVVTSRGPKTSLQNVLIDLENNAVVGTNLEQTVTVGIDASIRGEFASVSPDMAFVVPAARVAAILRESTDENITLETKKSTLHIKSGGSSFKMPLANVAEFPRMPYPEATTTREINQAELRDLLRVDFCCDNESSRYALGGICLSMAEDTITIGTDGRRMAKVISLENNGQKMGESAPVVPAVAARLAAKACGDSGIAVISCDNNSIVFYMGNVIVQSRLVEGKFPKWQDVFPSADANEFYMESVAADFNSAVRQAAIACGADSRGVELSVESGKPLVMSAKTSDVGESRVELNGDSTEWNGPPTAITLDNRYICDFMKRIRPEETIRMSLQNSEAAALFTAGRMSYVVMPLSK